MGYAAEQPIEVWHRMGPLKGLSAIYCDRRQFGQPIFLLLNTLYKTSGSPSWPHMILNEGEYKPNSAMV